MAKYDLFFKLAKEAGLEEAELYIGESRALSISMFHSAVDNYSDNNGMNIFARGVLNGKCGSASCDVWNKDKARFLVNEIVKNASIIENDDPIIIFKGSEKYKKVNTFNNELPTIPTDVKMAKLLELERLIKEADSRIIEVAEVQFEEVTEKVTLINSNGLNLKSKSNYFVYVGQCVAKSGEQTKSGFDFFLGNDFSKFDVKKFAKKIASDTVAQLGGTPCTSGKYKAVLAPSVVTSLLNVFVGHADAEEVQKHSSLFIDKLGKKIASSKITIEDRPLAKNIFARWFDDEGVATYNKPIVKNGVLQTYLYTLTTATLEGKQSTGNGFGMGSKKSANCPYLYLKPGKLSQAEMFEQVKEGVYITDVQGLHAGLNPQSGNFSLQSTGFMIRDGKKAEPLDIITVSGNLLKVFEDVIAVGNDVTISPSGVSAESMMIKSIAVSGK